MDAVWFVILCVFGWGMVSGWGLCVAWNKRSRIKDWVRSWR